MVKMKEIKIALYEERKEQNKTKFYLVWRYERIFTVVKAGINRSRLSPCEEG